MTAQTKDDLKKLIMEADENMSESLHAILYDDFAKADDKVSEAIRILRRTQSAIRREFR